MAGMKWSRCVGLVAVLGLSALLGACGPSKTELAAREENELLRTQNAEMSSKVSGLESSVSALNSKIDTLATRPVEPSGGTDRGNYNPPNSPSRSERRVDLGINLFNSGSDQLTANGKKSVDNAVKGISKGASVTVEGFADSTPIKKSKFPSNQALSEARAKSVASYLRSKGFSIADTVGYGSVSRNGKAPSRRVELVVAE